MELEDLLDSDADLLDCLRAAASYASHTASVALYFGEFEDFGCTGL